MQPYRPATSDLLSTVENFLTELEPRLDAADRYGAIVCRHLLAIAALELQAREANASGSAEQTSDIALVRDIRSGAHDAVLKPLLRELLGKIVERVRLTKPDHLAPQHQSSAIP